MRLRMNNEENPGIINLNIVHIKYNEFDEILELQIKPKELIAQEVYNILKGRFYKVLITQNGSRVLQLALKNTNYSILAKIFYEILPEIHDLMTNSYANYFCQKLYAILNTEERCQFLLQVNTINPG
jgi:hypothetical protein